MPNTITIPEIGFDSTLEAFLAQFDFYRDTRVFVKDTESRYVYANRAYADLLRTTPKAMIGKIDFDFFERNIADLYLEEDRKTLAGQKFVNQRWMVPDGNGVISWCISHKFPMRDRRGAVCGIFGTFRDLKMAGVEAKPYFDLAEVVEYIHASYADHVTSADLAAILGLSVSQLNRKFTAALGQSPIRYLLGVRIDRATERLINTDDTVQSICFACGFHSQTYFNRQFKTITGTTPNEYRARYT